MENITMGKNHNDHGAYYSQKQDILVKDTLSMNSWTTGILAIGHFN